MFLRFLFLFLLITFAFHFIHILRITLFFIIRFLLNVILQYFYWLKFIEKIFQKWYHFRFMFFLLLIVYLFCRYFTFISIYVMNVIQFRVIASIHDIIFWELVSRWLNQIFIFWLLVLHLVQCIHNKWIIF